MSEKTITLLLSGTDYGRSGLGTYVRSVVPCLINEGKLDNISFKLLGTQADLDAFPELTRQVDCLTIPRRYERPALSALWHLRRGQSFLRKSQTHLALCLAGNRRLISPGVVPSVAVVHDLAQLHMPDKYDGLRMLYFHQFILKGLRAQSRLVAISESTRRDLSQVLDVSESGIRVVYNGVDASIFSRKNAPPELVKQAYKRACALALQEVNNADVQRLSLKPYFYYPARFEHPSKNHTRLLQAFAESGLSRS